MLVEATITNCISRRYLSKFATMKKQYPQLCSRTSLSRLVHGLITSSIFCLLFPIYTHGLPYDSIRVSSAPAVSYEAIARAALDTILHEYWPDRPLTNDMFL